MTILYAISAADAIKFGVTDNSIQSRIETMQTGNAHELVIAAEYQTDFAYELEAEIFEFLSDYCIRGEWYFPSAIVLGVVAVMRNGDLKQFLSRDGDLQEVPVNWRAMVRVADKRRVYMKNYMRDYRSRGG